MIASNNIGITFSHPQLNYLDIPLSLALETAVSLNCSYIRIGSYWNQIETTQGVYDFSSLTTILDYFQKHQQKVVVTLGVKAPRWPEFYWPDFISDTTTTNPHTQDHILTYITKTVNHLKHYACITHWQVENEPLDPSGPENTTIDLDFLEKEVRLVRSLDNRPIIITLWGNELVKRGLLKNVTQLADIVGIDLYYKQYVMTILGKDVYSPPLQSHSQLKKLLGKTDTPIWITELQAEPWEKDEAGYKADTPASISPELVQKNIERTKDLPVAQTLLWGFEYWLWRAQQGDTRYLDLFK